MSSSIRPRMIAPGFARVLAMLIALAIACAMIAAPPATAKQKPNY